jgi:hypothetical protein
MGAKTFRRTIGRLIFVAISATMFYICSDRPTTFVPSHVMAA